MRESGLKSKYTAELIKYTLVSLHAREWIEILMIDVMMDIKAVSLHAREWIEILKLNLAD